MPKVAKATKKAATKRKPKPKPIPRELWVRSSEGNIDTTYVEGHNCTGFEYNSGSMVPWFKVYFDDFSITTIGVPYSIVEPLK